MSSDADNFIAKFLEDTLAAASTLYEKRLYGHFFVVLYSSIDSMGLLNAAPTQTEATGQTFKDWVRKYIITQPDVEFNEIDLWGARCGVLHTFTSQSKLSNEGKAKQIQYYSGPKDSEVAKAFVTATKQIDDGAHIPVHIEDTYLAFLRAIQEFAVDLAENCAKDAAYEARLRNVLQQFML